MAWAGDGVVVAEHFPGRCNKVSGKGGRGLSLVARVENASIQFEKRG